MKIVVQRVKEASVSVNGESLAQIGPGFLVLIGIGEEDDKEIARKMAHKVSKLRVMADEKKDMNLDLHKVGGEVLVVSQFTLCADTSQGNRPSFIKAADPETAEELYELFVEELRGTGLEVQTGQFGAYMEVFLINDGPVTIVL